MWRELAEDARAFRRLRASTSGRDPWWLVWLSSPGLFALLAQRLMHRFAEYRRDHSRSPIVPVLQFVQASLQVLVVIRAKCETLVAADIAGGVYISDRGYVILGARRVGAGSQIHERVTVGIGLSDQGLPQIGERVWIGKDCVIFGDIVIGDEATILPGSVLSKSIPSRTLVGGNPARVLRRDFDNAPLRAVLPTDERITELTR
jgi:serine O-acetyltransferase